MCKVTDQINQRASENYNRTKEKSDMSLKDHNDSQTCAIQGLIDRERWLLSERLGYDCTSTATGLCMLNHRVADIVSGGFGKYLNELETTKPIKS